MTRWCRFCGISTKLSFRGELQNVITIQLNIFSRIPKLLLFVPSSAFCWYLSLACQVPGAPARTVTHTQTDTHTMSTITSPPHGARLTTPPHTSECLCICMYVCVPYMPLLPTVHDEHDNPRTDLNGATDQLLSIATTIPWNYYFTQLHTYLTWCYYTDSLPSPITIPELSLYSQPVSTHFTPLKHNTSIHVHPPHNQLS